MTAGPNYLQKMLPKDLTDLLLKKAVTIDELLSNDFEVSSSVDSSCAARRLAAWCKSCAAGDWGIFKRRLQRDHIDIDEASIRLGSARRKVELPAPLWLSDSLWIASALTSRSEMYDVASDAELPFEELFHLLVAQAELAVWSDLAFERELFSAKAHGQLRHLLLTELCQLTSAVLFRDFSRHRTRAANVGALNKLEGRSAYRSFVDFMRASGWGNQIRESPVLLRLMATLTRNWIDGTREMIQRLSADWQSIERLLGERSFASVEGVRGNVSDSHNRGRAVRILTLSSGDKIVYKPKSLEPDAAVYRLVSTLNQAAPLRLRVPKIVLRPDYGWSEYIESSTDCVDTSSYYEKAGAWLGLLYSIGGTDFHQENLVATSAGPVPIDFEMILQAPAGSSRPAVEDEAFEELFDSLSRSVTSVGMLPQYIRSPDHSLSVSGGLALTATSGVEVNWAGINTDSMQPTFATASSREPANLPLENGRPVLFAEHLDSFLKGFRSYYDFLLSRVETIRAHMSEHSRMSIRRVLRPTRFYQLLLHRMRDVENMSDGITWSMQADFVTRFSDWDGEHDALWSLYAAERQALYQLDVPYFTQIAEDPMVFDSFGASASWPTGAGLQEAKRRIGGLNATDQSFQSDLIRHSAAVRTSRRSENGLTAVVDDNGRKVAIAAATDRLAHEIRGYATQRSSSAAWLGLDWLGHASYCQVVPLGPDLYNGASGIALFLAAHARTRRDAHSRELALHALSSLRKNLKSRNASRFARALGIGGLTGLGSLIYSLTTIGEMLSDRELLQDALAASELMSEDIVAADQDLDLVGGSAGAILALLKLHRVSGVPSSLLLATKCGEHLLAQERVWYGATRSWLGGGCGPRPLCGLSHGASGFGYALAALAKATGRVEFGDAALDCIDHELAHFSVERENWPTWTKSTDKPSWPCQWCHGAVGIGLARAALYSLGWGDSARLLSDIQSAVSRTLHEGRLDQDSLCCGELGAVELLKSASQLLGEPELGAIASHRLDSVLAREASCGDFRWDVGTRVFNPSLFRGLAGVGYTLLREIDDSLSNVLLLN